MPPGSKPQPAGKSDQRETVFKWNLAETEGWQHGKIPAARRQPLRPWKARVEDMDERLVGQLLLSRGSARTPTPRHAL
jgi:hypothetical protein